MDDIKDFNEIIRKMIEQAAKQGGDQPMAYGIRIIITGDGLFGSDEDEEMPDAEVQTIDDEVKVVAEVPGATTDDVHIGLQGNELSIDAITGQGPYHTTVEVPPVDGTSMAYAVRNSVLEVTFRKAAAVTGQ